jgi:riboflavin kinase/FMN adenylyltransferase
VLTPLPLKLALLERLGMAAAVVLHFSEELAALDAWAFVEQVLVERLRVAGVSVGYDFGFGRGRTGTVDLLREAAGRHGFRLDVAPPVTVDGQVVSSRAIRGLLAEGKVAEAQPLLGRPYCLAGVVQPGAGRGQGLGFATANLAVPARGALQDGVYAGRVFLRGAFRDAMMNHGRGPTFGDGERRLEIHLPEWNEPLYGERLLVFFLARLRDEQRFPDAAALTRQLTADRQNAAAVWRESASFPWPEWTLHL